jgi:hypothetical protein
MTVFEGAKRIGIMLGGMAALVLVVAGAQWLTRHRLPGWLDAVVILLVALGAYVLYVRLTERRRVDELAPALLAPQGLLGLLIGVVLFSAVIGLLVATGTYHYVGYGSIPSVFTAFATTLTAATIEELLFRGFLFRVVQSIAGTWIGAAISAIVFGALHAFNAHATVLSSIAIAIEAGALLAMAYAATQRLWLPIGLHLGWNFTEGSVFGVSVSGHHASPGLVRGVLNGPDYLTGGGFGIEASALAVLVCSVATVFFIGYAVRAGRIVPRVPNPVSRFLKPA